MNAKNTLSRISSAAALAVLLTMGLARSASAAGTNERIKDANDTLAEFVKKDPALTTHLNEAAGYVVFPVIKKGAIAVGGAAGDGILFEKGKPIGRASMAQVTVGLALGGQSYSELIILQTPSALTAFKRGNLAFAAQASGVVAAAGASADAKYERGVAVFTIPRSGLMGEASVGGQKFKFEEFEVPHPGT